MESFATIVDSFECREDSHKEVLIVGVEGRSDIGCIFWLVDSGGLKVIFEIGVEGRIEFVLPPDVVGVASGPANFVISECLL